jgi:hypothetical protein
MKSGIDRDFYCKGGFFETKGTSAKNGYCKYMDCACKCGNCSLRCLKWPAPEQFKEEYGRNVPDDMPVWALKRASMMNRGQIIDSSYWELTQYGLYKNPPYDCYALAVVACTPWGKPPDTWRPGSI